MRRCLNQLERLPAQARVRVARYLFDVASDWRPQPLPTVINNVDPRQQALPGLDPLGDDIP